jgi:hypothetical protein
VKSEGTWTGGLVEAGVHTWTTMSCANKNRFSIQLTGELTLTSES